MFSILQLSEWWRIIHHLPWWAFIYSGILALISWGSLSVYIYYDGNLSNEAIDQMFLYITLIIAWLVTTRPDSALDVHEKLTEQVFDIMHKLRTLSKKIVNPNEKKKRPDPPNSDSSNKKKKETEPNKTFSQFFLYVVTNISSRPVSHKRKKLSSEEIEHLEKDVFSEDYMEILKGLNTFQTQQRLALPAALHGMCVLLTFVFHTVFVPIVLYSHELDYQTSIICNFILAFYTTGCLEVAIKLEHPFRDVTQTDENPPTKEFQVMYTEIIKVLKTIPKLSPDTQTFAEDLVAYLKDTYDFNIEENAHYKTQKEIAKECFAKTRSNSYVVCPVRESEF